MVVRFFASLREITGEATLDRAAPAADLGELLESLATGYGPQFRRAVLDGKGLAPAAMVLVNGHNARFTGGTETPLQAGDEVALFPPLGGG